MEQQHFNTIEEGRKAGSHLTPVERGMIQALHDKGYSLRKIAAEVGCAISTVHYELIRGTPARKGSRGPQPKYTAKRGQRAYLEHRKNSRRKCKIDSDDCQPFLKWMTAKIRQERWSIDACVGYARCQKLFPYNQIPATKTLYNMLWQKKLEITPWDLPRALKMRARRGNGGHAINKTILGTSIDDRPACASDGSQIGHWEVDTVVGKRKGREAVIFTAVEKVTRKYIALRISGRSTNGMAEAIARLKDEYGDKFPVVFKSMTADNGCEFTNLSSYEDLGTKVYFAHPYSSWERGQNERHNGLLREYIAKGRSIELYSDDDILNIADCINSRPRRVLGYKTPEELFEQFLDTVYTI